MFVWIVLGVIFFFFVKMAKDHKFIMNCVCAMQQYENGFFFMSFIYGCMAAILKLKEKSVFN